MHGRLKVKTTEEQAEAKRLEREKKLRQYVTVTKAVFEKRKLGQLDKEGLELSSQILGANPDFATLWNFRREIFLHLQEETPDEMQALYKAELSFLESCLCVNPKSYGTWHHRCWVMEHIPEPDWVRELELCGKFLESDERNFHCWDYRRFVVQRSQVAPQDELAFSDSLITRNFSNYSSWHYRSRLLPQLYPDPHQQGRITEEILLKELELVQNAFFTDPNDQSAWFYHRWLLGRADPAPTIRSIYVSREDDTLAVAFSHPVEVAPASHDLIVFGDESPLVVRWHTPDRRNRPGFIFATCPPSLSMTTGPSTPSGSCGRRAMLRRSVSFSKDIKTVGARIRSQRNKYSDVSCQLRSRQCSSPNWNLARNCRLWNLRTNGASSPSSSS